MSMNLAVSAKAVATLPNGKKIKIRHSFSLVQTPTDVSYELIKAPDIAKAYLSWLRDDGDYDMIVRTRELNDWIKQHQEDGYTIDWFVI